MNVTLAMCSRNFEAEPAGGAARAAFGVYVHFPYCLKKCPYCDFVSFRSARDEIPHVEYADAILRELDARGGELGGRRLSTIFFGGGTPSLWDPRELGRVLRAVVDRFGGGDVEITAECNPTSLDVDRARALGDAGVNRLSVGVQGLDDARLRFLGRLHRADEGLRAVEAALEANIGRVSADLIYAVAPDGESEPPEVAAAEATRVARTGVTHVSAYALTIEPNTEFGALAKKGKLPIAPDDLVVDSFFAVERALGELGFAHYETSNYARPGDESRHNLGYWRGVDYLGLGAGAVGTLGAGATARRYRNVGDPRKYVAASSDPAAISLESETLTGNDRLNERIMLGLRLAEGIDLAECASDLAVEPIPPERARALERLERQGRIVRAGTRIVVPAEKRALVDGIAASLFV